MENLKQKVAKGAVWAMLEKLGLQLVSFGVTLVLARLLTPTDYGTVALLYVFMGIAGSLSDCGFGQALVQKKNATELDFNSVFYISMALAFIMYGVLFCCACCSKRGLLGGRSGESTHGVGLRNSFDSRFFSWQAQITQAIIISRSGRQQTPLSARTSTTRSARSTRA